MTPNSQSGQSLVEVIAAAFILGLLAIALSGISMLGTQTAQVSEQKTVAQAIANKKVELIKLIPYEDIGYNDGSVPDGKLPPTEEITQNEQSYQITTTVDLIDDPETESSADYKKVTISVKYPKADIPEKETKVTFFATPGQSRSILDLVECSPIDTTGSCPAGQICCDETCLPACEPGTCPDGYKCSDDSCGCVLESTSYNAAGCINDFECAAEDEQCLGGWCQPYCNDSDDCSSSENCYYGFCEKTCEVNNQCAKDKVCVDGLCQPPPCQQDSQCDGGYKCIDFHCVPEPCSFNRECDPSYKCIEGACMPDPCHADECPGDWTCAGGSIISPSNGDGTVASSVKIAHETNGGPTLFNSSFGGDHFGSSAANIGDLNGDGISDLAVGAYADNTGGQAYPGDRGAAYILFMNTDGTVSSSSKIAHETNGGPNLADKDKFGISIASLGDLNNDSVPDIVVGAYGDDTGGDAKGAIYVLFMNEDGTVDSSKTKKIAHETNGGPTLTDMSLFGYSVANIGDLDGDGITDLAVGAWGDDTGGDAKGAIYVLFMNEDGTVDSSKTKKIAHETNGGPPLEGDNRFAYSIANMGDLNGDGISDLAVGAEGEINDIGAVYVLFMNANGTVSSFRKIANETNGGPTLDTHVKFGYSVANIGDLNGDGIIDLAVGAIGEGTCCTMDGATYILFMNTDGTVSTFKKIAHETNGGPTLANFDLFGYAVTGLGDLDGDGILDLAVGASGDDNHRGAAYVLFMADDNTEVIGGTCQPPEDVTEPQIINDKCPASITSPCFAAVGQVVTNWQPVEGEDFCQPITEILDCNPDAGVWSDTDANDIPNCGSDGSANSCTPPKPIECGTGCEGSGCGSCADGETCLEGRCFPEPPCPDGYTEYPDPASAWCYGADLDHNGNVVASDVSIMASNFGSTDCSASNNWCNRADINQDGKVVSSDVDILASHFGEFGCGPAYTGLSSMCTDTPNVCVKEWTAQPVTSCSVDSDCSGDSYCSDNECTTAGCQTNEQCQAYGDYFCRNLVCVPAQERDCSYCEPYGDLRLYNCHEKDCATCDNGEGSLCTDPLGVSSTVVWAQDKDTGCKYLTCSYAESVCGNGIVQPGEDCDPPGGTSCPTGDTCSSSCSCPEPVCGNNVREGVEDCDGTDDSACPGYCGTPIDGTGPCRCPQPTRQPLCGNGIIDESAGEECDPNTIHDTCSDADQQCDEIDCICY